MAAPRRISRESIVMAALAIIDDEGLQALVVRNVAHRLGVQPGALYKHFRDMDELKAEIVWEATKAAGAVPLTDTTWQDAVRRHVRVFVDALLQHPNVMPLLVGPAGQRIWTSRLYEGFGPELQHLVRLMADDGITADRALTAVDTLEAFSIGIATVSAARNEGPEIGGFLSALGADGHAETGDRFERALECLVEGLASLRSRPAHRASKAAAR